LAHRATLAQLTVQRGRIYILAMTVANATPLQSLDEWEDFVKDRYPEPGKPALPFKVTDPEKKQEEFRNYAKEARPSVKEFYRLNHTFQTHEFVKQKRADFLRFNRREMTVWEAAEYLNNLVDDSDPDTDMSQLEHLLQTAEQIRKDGKPRWFILTGFIHDLGKILCLYGEPQWAVVGDTFPVGCRYSKKIVFHEFFEANPDSKDATLQTELGVYERGCGLDNVMMSWGHDEYIYQVVKDRMPDESLYMLRYHSFYPAHREGEYDYLMNDKDRKMFDAVRQFNPYDLYTKSHEKPDVAKLRPFYEDLINEFLPGKLRW
jgi:inositol oxygenase